MIFAETEKRLIEVGTQSDTQEILKSGQKNVGADKGAVIGKLLTGADLCTHLRSV